MPWLKINRNSTAILALVRLCKTDGQDASLTPVWYQDLGTVWAFDIATIDCIIGQLKVGNCWGIVDQSFGLEHAVIHGMWEPDNESEDEND